MIRLLLVEDQEIVRRGLKTLLETKPDLRVVGEAGNGQQAIELVEQLHATEQDPEVILMDIRMPEMDGIEATRIIKTKLAQIPVIVLTLYSEYKAAALAAGANAFLIKGESVEQLLAVLLTAISTN